MAKPIATSRGRAGAFIAGFLLTPEFLQTSPVTLANFFSQRHLISDMNRITKKIDNAVDSTPPSEIATADFSIDEQGLSRFLGNKKYIPAAYMETINHMVDAGLIAQDAATGYSNFFCEKIKARADLQTALALSDDPLLRHSMASRNLDFGAVFGTFFFGFSKPVPDGYFLSKGGVSFESVRAAYPSIYTLCYLGQVLDDMRDILVDLEDEIKNNVINPNIFLANAMSTSQGVAEMHSFYNDVALLPHAIDAAQFPASLRESFDTMSQIFSESVTRVDGAITRAILETFWVNSHLQGFKGATHPDIIEGRKAHEARYEAFK